MVSLIPTLNLFGGSVGITDFTNISSIESINLYNESFIQIDGNSEVYLSNSLINFYDNSLFKVSENAVLITLGSEVYLHNSCKFELLSQCNGHFSSLNLLQDSTLDYSCFGDFYIATFNHYGGTRTGDTELVINDFYHWNSGLLISKTTHSSTIIKGEGLFDGSEDLIMENHKLLIEGHAVWNSGNFVLNSNGEFNVSDQGLFTINLDSNGIITGDSDSNSFVSNYGKVEKICEALLSIDAKVVNNGNFVIRNGTLDLNQEFDIVNGEAFVSKLKVKVINGNVEFKENVQVDSLFVDLVDGLVEFNGNSKVSLIPTLNLFGGSVGITDFTNISSIESINLHNESFIQIDGNSEVYLSNSLINFYDNSLFKVSENAVLITLGSEVYLHNSCQFELLSQCNGHFSSLNLLQDSTFDYSCFGDFYIATFNHHGGTRTGNTELVINDFYHWNSGLLTSKTTHSSTIIKGEGLFDGNEDLNLENHKLLIEGHTVWNSGNFVLNSNGEFNVSDQGLFTIDLNSSGIITGDSDSNSLVSNYGKVEKNCESLLSIDAKVVNNGNFVIRNGTLDLNQEFDIVNGNLLLENPGKLNLNNLLNVRESGSLESYSLLLLNNSNSQLIVAGYLDVAENFIIDSFGSAVFQGEAFVSKLMVKVINGNVEFKENVQVDSLFVDVFDGLVEFNGNSKVTSIPTLNLFGGSVGITDFANVTSIESINLYNESFIQIDGNSEVYLSNSLINFYDNSLFKVSENAIQHLIIHALVTFYIATFNHYGGTRTGDTELVINDFYHWNSGLLTSKTTHSSTIIKGEGLFDGNEDLNLENHKLLIEGHTVWNSGNFVLNSNGEFNVSDQGLFTIDLNSSGIITGDSDSNSLVSNYGKVEKNCESLLSIDAKVVNNGNFVIRNGTLDLNQEFDIVNGNLLLENPGKLNLNNILNVRESGSLESYSLLLLNNSNSQLIVAGYLDVAENIIIDSFGSAVFQGEAFVSKLMVKVINGNVEFKENVQVDSLFVDLVDGLVEFNGNSKVSLIPTLNLFGGSVGITDFTNISSIESINLYNESFIQIDGNSEVYLSNSLINFYDNSLFKVSENAVLITLGSEVYLHNSCKFELLSQCNGHFSSLNLLQDSTLDYSCFGDFYIATFNHYGGTRTGDTELVINDFYHWNSGLLISKTTHSSTIIKGEGLFDGSEDLIMENHKLLIEGHAVWNSGNFVLNSNGEFNVSDQGLFTINLDSNGIITGDSDSNSFVSNYGKVEKICEALLSIDAKVVNNGNFVIRNGTLDLNQEFDIVNGNLLLENPGKLNLNNILNVRESGSLESYSLLLLNNSNSQLIVAGYLDVAENIIIDSFGSAVFQGEAFVSKLKVKVINGNVEFKENVQVDSLFVDLVDGLVEFNGNSKVSLIPTLNLFGGSVGITDFTNISSIESINLYNESFIQIDGNSEVYLSNSLINFYDNSLFKVSENAVLITLGSEVYLHNSCKFELLSQCNGHFSSLNLLQDSTLDYSCFGDFYIATFNHYGGTRTGDTELVINDFYHWNSGLLISKTTHSSTIIKGEGLFDGNKDLNLENHKLIIEGHAVWNSGNFVLNSNGEFNVSDHGLFTIDVNSSGIITGDSDSNSLVSNYGKVEKICESLLFIDAKVVNNGNFVIGNGTLDLNQEFDIVNGNFLLENSGKLNLNNILNVRESGSLESYSLLLLNNSNSQLIVAGNLDVAENIIIDSFGSAVFQGEAFVSKLMVKVINGNVEFKENVQVDSLFVDVFDGLVEFNDNSKVSSIPTLNLFGGSASITDFTNITSIELINLHNESFIQIEGNSEVYLSNSLINFYDNSLFKVSENAVLITLGSEVYLHNSCEFELLSQCNGHFSSLNLLQDSTFDYSCFGDFYIATFNHYGGTRTGDTELVINDFYHWNSGLLTSKSTHSSTIIKGEGLLTINLDSSGIITGDSDSNSLVSNYGKVEKICESPLSIDAKVVNNGNFVIRNGTLDLNQEFDIVNGSLLLENPGKLNLNNILNVRESGSLESYSLLLLNNSNSQLIVAGNLVVAENIIIDSFGSAVFQGEAFVSKLMVKVINGNVEFKENVQVDSLFVDVFDGLVDFNDNSKVSSIPTLNLFGGSVGITDFTNITSIESINLYNESFIQIDGNSEVYLSNSLINFYDNSLFKLSENAGLITWGSEVYLHNSCKFELLSQCNGHFSSLNLLQDSTLDYSCFGDFYIATFNHYGGTRTGDTELVINDFYHWNSGLLTSKTTHSSTIIKGEGIFDGNKDLNLENHKLIIEGHAVWNSGNFVLNSNGEFNVSDQGLLTINLDSSGVITGVSDSNSFVSNYGKVEKICESPLSIDAKVVNNGNFVIRNGTLDLNQEFDIVTGNLLLENPGKLNLINILNVRESGSLESYSLLLLNNSNSQLIVAGNLDVAENIIIDSFGSAVFQGEAFVSKLMVKVINGNVEFKENVQVDSLFVDLFDGLVGFNGNSKVTSIPTLNLFGGSVGITDFANVTSIESINLHNESFIQIEGNSEVYLSNCLIIFYDNSLFKVSENAVLITLGSEVYLHNSCKFELLSQCNGHFSSLNLLQDSTLDYSCFGDFYIATFNHYGGTRTGDTELVINDFYHWNSGLLTSKTTHSSTIIKGEGLFDGNKDLNLENHKLIIEGHAVWNSGNFVLNSNGEFNVSDHGLFTIDVNSSGIITGDSDSNSLVSNYGKVEKICESLLFIDAKVVNNGNFVIGNGTLDLNQEFDIVNGNFLLENSGKLNLNNILNVRESGSLESYSLLLLNNSNSQLIVAGNLDVAENIIIDSFGSAVFQGEAFVSRLMVKVINGNVEFKENVQVDSLFVDVFDGLVDFNDNSKVSSIPTLNLFGGSVGITDFTNITSIESINLYNESFIQIDGNSEVYLSNSLINFYDNSLFKLSENAGLITWGSEVYLHNSCQFELLSQCNGHFSSLNLLQDSTFDFSCFGDSYIATFNHYGGTRTGDTELVINDFYHWISGLLTSKTTHSSTIIKGEGLFDGNEDLNLENHKLIIEGHAVWNSGNFVSFEFSSSVLFTKSSTLSISSTQTVSHIPFFIDGSLLLKNSTVSFNQPLELSFTSTLMVGSGISVLEGIITATNCSVELHGQIAFNHAIVTLHNLYLMPVAELLNSFATDSSLQSTGIKFSYSDVYLSNIDLSDAVLISNTSNITLSFIPNIQSLFCFKSSYHFEMGEVRMLNSHFDQCSVSSTNVTTVTYASSCVVSNGLNVDSCHLLIEGNMTLLPSGLSMDSYSKLSVLFNAILNISGSPVIMSSRMAGPISNDGLISMSNGDVLFDSVLFFNHGSVKLCHSNFTMYMSGLQNLALLFSCNDSINSINFINTTAALFTNMESFSGNMIIEDSVVAIYSWVKMSINIYSGQLHVLSSSHLDGTVVCDIQCQIVEDFGDTQPRDDFWMNYCDQQGLFLLENSTVNRVEVIAGVVHVANNSFMNELELKSENSLLYVQNSTSTFVSPGPFGYEGFIVGSGKVMLDEMYCTYSYCRFFTDEFFCFEHHSCHDCVTDPNCGWVMDNKFCVSASNGVSSHGFFEYFYYDSCLECELVQNVRPSDLSFTSSINPYNGNTITIDVHVPYVRQGHTWLIDFAEVADVSLNTITVGTCSNKEGGFLDEVDRDYFHYSAPHSSLGFALNSTYYLPYSPSNIWRQYSPSCELVGYEVDLTFGDFSACLIDGTSATVSTPFLHVNITLSVALIELSLDGKADEMMLNVKHPILASLIAFASYEHRGSFVQNVDERPLFQDYWFSFEKQDSAEINFKQDDPIELTDVAFTDSNCKHKVEKVGSVFKMVITQTHGPISNCFPIDATFAVDDSGFVDLSIVPTFINLLSESSSTTLMLSTQKLNVEYPYQSIIAHSSMGPFESGENVYFHLKHRQKRHDVGIKTSLICTKSLLVHKNQRDLEPDCHNLVIKNIETAYGQTDTVIIGYITLPEVSIRSLLSISLVFTFADDNGVHESEAEAHLLCVPPVISAQKRAFLVVVAVVVLFVLCVIIGLFVVRKRRKDLVKYSSPVASSKTSIPLSESHHVSGTHQRSKTVPIAAFSKIPLHHRMRSLPLTSNKEIPGDVEPVEPFEPNTNSDSTNVVNEPSPLSLPTPKPIRNALPKLQQRPSPIHSTASPRLNNSKNSEKTKTPGSSTFNESISCVSQVKSSQSNQSQIVALSPNDVFSPASNTLANSLHSSSPCVSSSFSRNELQNVFKRAESKQVGSIKQGLSHSKVKAKAALSSLGPKNHHYSRYSTLPGVFDSPIRSSNATDKTNPPIDSSSVQVARPSGLATSDRLPNIEPHLVTSPYRSDPLKEEQSQNRILPRQLPPVPFAGIRAPRRRVGRNSTRGK
ncbi:hypothetical protein P9112_000561 [Eukaryota sp. TZLM1-RC]